jgi:hypothetical protein
MGSAITKHNKLADKCDYDLIYPINESVPQNQSSRNPIEAMICTSQDISRDISIVKDLIGCIKSGNIAKIYSHWKFDTICNINIMNDKVHTS